jgi:wyosine [tRNA(Phe)-imidazoG37] synthetase (radical SAM superfamily)
MTSIAFGPVPSRRLGQSLGINDIPPKVCTYSCLYCQLGPTPETSLARAAFYAPQHVVAQVTERVQALRARGEPIDYLTFVPDGEPTLDLHLGDMIDGLKPLGIRIAVISNGSLVWQEEVRAALAKADWVSLKVDSADETVWRRINRPDPSLRLQTVLDGMAAFSRSYHGRLVTETMLLDGVNDDPATVRATAAFVAALRPHTAYLLVPTRPTATAEARCPSEEAVTRAYEIFAARLVRVELLTGGETAAFGATGDAESDLLSTAAVHPMRAEAVRELLAKDGAAWQVVEQLVSRELLKEIEYEGETFYVRRFTLKRGLIPPR